MNVSNEPEFKRSPPGRTLKLSLASKNARFQRLGGAAEHAKALARAKGLRINQWMILCFFCYAWLCFAQPGYAASNG